MPHPEGWTSCSLHPVAVSWVSMCSGISPQLARSSGDQEVRGQIPVAAAGRVDPGELHAILVFPVVAVGGMNFVIILIIPLIVTIITVIMIIIFILVIFITTTAIIIIEKKEM